MINSFDDCFIVQFDFESIKDYMPEARYDAIMDHLEKLSHLESSIYCERIRLLTVAGELECQKLYSSTIIKENLNDNE